MRDSSALEVPQADFGGWEESGNAIGRVVESPESPEWGAIFLVLWTGGPKAAKEGMLSKTQICLNFVVTIIFLLIM